MRRSYESPLPLQEGWSSLQTHSRARRDTHRGLALVSGRLGNLHARTALRACSKNLQIAPNCGSWVRDFHLLMDLFDRNGVKFVSVTQSLDTQSPMGRLLRNVLLDFAQFEREMTADRTRDKMYQRAEKGLWNGGNVPYGYVAENKRLMVNAEEGERVRFIFHRFADAPSLAGLRDELHRRGWYTRSGKPWSKTALDQILRNPIYCGLIRFNEDRFKGEHAALIEETLYKNVQSVRRDRSHRSTKLSRVFLLKGLIRCSECGSAMTPHYTQKRHKDGSVYRIP